jgi:hypothetical protein
MLWLLLTYRATVLHTGALQNEAKQTYDTYEIWYKELKYCIYKQVREQVNEEQQ